MKDEKWYCEVQAPPELHEHIEQLFNAISYKIRHADGYIEGYKYWLEKSIEPNLGNNGSIYTKTGENDEDRTTNDCISRKQAIEAFEPTHYKDWYTPTIIETLETLPSVRPEVLACGNGELVKESGGLVKDLVKDCISRQQAIDALDKHIDTFDAIDKNYLSGLRTAMSILKEMPSAQPETHDKRTETHACDLISRQAVKHLDLFTKTYCRDESVKDDLVFRCNQCDFRLPDETCLVKTMARKLCKDYREFGSMGDL